MVKATHNFVFETMKRSKPFALSQPMLMKLFNLNKKATKRTTNIFYQLKVQTTFNLLTQQSTKFTDQMSSINLTSVAGTGATNCLTRTRFVFNQPCKKKK